MANSIYGIKVDMERGFDVVRYVQKQERVEHFGSYEEARDYAAKYKGAVVRYWQAK